MSAKMTFRQKLIRVGCSSAICGLSFSFLMGEVVDQKAKFLRSWVVDPALLPTEYRPAQPLLAISKHPGGQALLDNLVVLNSLPKTLVSPLPAMTMQPLLASAPLPTVEAATGATNIDRVVSLAAAPEKGTSDKMATVPAMSKRPSKTPAAEVIAERKQGAVVEELLVSIHDATAKISAPYYKDTNPPKVKVGTMASAPKNSNLPSTDATIIGEPKGSVPAAALIAGGNDTPANVVGKASNSKWTIEGQVLANTSAPEVGHYEIGLFSKVDADGIPVGFPVVQQILPAGQSKFRLSVSAKIEQGYLYGEFVAAKTGKRTWIGPQSNPWNRTSKNLAELFVRPHDTVVTTAAVPVRDQASKQIKIQGTVTTMFAPATAQIFQEDVIVRVRGRKEAARTDKKGIFSLEIPKIRGTVFLEFLKQGYHPTILSLAAEDTVNVKVELASRHAIDQVSQRLGSPQGSMKGVFIGRAVNPDGTALRGLSAQTSLRADGPFYFDEDGQPTRDLKSTSTDGRFLFLNLDSGVGFIETALNGEPVAPFQLSTVEGGELAQRVLVPVSGSLRGRIFNPVAGGDGLSPVRAAKVRLDGATDWYTTDSFGSFSIGSLKWMRGEKLLLEFSAERFNNHRYVVTPDAQAQLSLYAFPAGYVSKLAQSMDLDLDPYAGIVIGKVAGMSLRIDALSDHSTVNNAKDFYFDSRGRLRGSHEMTDPKFGTYIIFNVPKGHTILQGSDAAGSPKYSDSVYSNPSSVSVIME